MNDKHAPAGGTKARVKTSDRGGNIKPENITGRSKTSGRGIVEPEARAPQGVSATIKPENYKSRSTGDYQKPKNAAARMNPTRPMATRQTPRFDSKNPLK